MSVRTFLFLCLCLALIGFAGTASSSHAAEPDWQDIRAAARGQTVYWNAWAGDERINAYIAWAGERLRESDGIEVVHVKLADTAEVVARVLAEKVSGNDSDGSVDLVWINGENFAAMKEKGLLFGPFTQRLPNFALVDVAGKPTTLIDFTIPTDGLEAPWGMAKFNLIYDSARVPSLPGDIAGLRAWAEANPGRFTYPAPPDFLGSTFLKQVLAELVEDAGRLQAPAGEGADFAAVTAPLWGYLDALHPHLWRGGLAFPVSGPAQRQLLDDGEVDVTLSFYPSEASSLIENGLLPDSARVAFLAGGTIGNTHFVAIPYNARAKEGAQVLANFLMSPEAQAHKQDSRVWGDDTVLAVARLPEAERAAFADLPRGPATVAPQDQGPTLLEPHPSWMTLIEAEWLRRYSR